MSVKSVIGIKRKHEEFHTDPGGEEDDLVKKKPHKLNISEPDKIRGESMSWGYGSDNGPEKWVEKFLDGKAIRQSPVDIAPTKVKVDDSLSTNPLSIKYSEEGDLQLENPGLSFKINISGNSIISGGPLADKKYKLVQFHFHWGHQDSEGSEHRINGKMYPSELHLVHYNADKYASFGEAVAEPDGLAVIGVFIKVGKSHKGFTALSDNAAKVKSKGAKVNTGNKFNPSCLLPKNTSDYWTYDGSLTTPPLCESVTWIVLKDEIEISAEQMGSMRNLNCDEDGEERIPANWRPPQPLGSREIKASFACC